MITIFNTSLSSQAAVHVNSSADRIEARTGRLSSGTRLNTTVDDAGATAQSMQFTAASGRAAIVGNQVTDAVSFLEVQSTALRQLYGIMNRISELRSRATDATMVPVISNAGGSTDPNAIASKTTGDRYGYQTEYEALRQQLVSATQVEFNGKPVFGAVASTMSVQLTEDGGQTMTISRHSLYDGTAFLSAAPSAGSTASSGALGVFHDQPTLIDLNISDLDKSIQTLSAHIATNVGEQSRLRMNADRLGTTKFDFDSANSRFADLDVAKETVSLTQARAVHQAAVNVLTQANKSTEYILKLIESRQGV
jgi:flagellin